ncbi:VOC family protein [Stenotrophomonas sp. PS02289]|uniref:VOC family protein n=1 Tax=Stenotrophomonas sp. PS02289 TaxID=2991422 RepID=UPI00249AFFC6|nr:VOC family protein [Stenotrophomonas sp. PS02289]
MKLIPFLGFNGQTHEAMAFYAKVLRGNVTSETKYGDMPPSDNMDGCGDAPGPLDPNLVAHSQLEVGEAILMAADGPPSDGAGTTTINIDVDSIEEAERVFKELSEGGKVTMAIGETFWAHRWGMLEDKYGKPWMVNFMKSFP